MKCSLCGRARPGQASRSSNSRLGVLFALFALPRPPLGPIYLVSHWPVLPGLRTNRDLPQGLAPLVRSCFVICYAVLRKGSRIAQSPLDQCTSNHGQVGPFRFPNSVHCKPWPTASPTRTAHGSAVVLDLAISTLRVPYKVRSTMRSYSAPPHTMYKTAPEACPVSVPYQPEKWAKEAE